MWHVLVGPLGSLSYNLDRYKSKCTLSKNNLAGISDLDPGLAKL